MKKIKKELLLSQQNILRQFPKNILPGDHWIYDSDRLVQTEELFLTEYHNVFVSPESIVWSQLSIDKELLIHPHHTEMYNWKYCISNYVKRKRMNLQDGDYFLCTDYWAANYYHWLCDALPRVFMVKDYLKNGTLLLPGQYTAPFYLETLKAFEIREIKPMPVKNYFYLPRLYTVPQPVVCGQQVNLLTSGLRQHLLNYFKPQFKGAHVYESVYISRRKAAYRWVLNEEEIVAELEKRGYKVICFEDYTFVEQLEISYNAKNMISLHGANLTNVMFMKPGANVLEFRKPNAKPGSGNNSFWVLADALGVNYYYLNCEFIDRKEGNYFDVTVGIEEFKTVLDLIQQPSATSKF